MTSTLLPFTQSEALEAHTEWGCNCGPAALAFALQLPLSSVRFAIPGFAEKRFTSPGMMAAGIRHLRPARSRPYEIAEEVDRESMFDAEKRSIVRIQFAGPWTERGGNIKWAYSKTHWIATWAEQSGRDRLGWVYDVNSGPQMYPHWVEETVERLIESIPRANGEWYPTHIWRV